MAAEADQDPPVDSDDDEEPMFALPAVAPPLVPPVGLVAPNPVLPAAALPPHPGAPAAAPLPVAPGIGTFSRMPGRDNQILDYNGPGKNAARKIWEKAIVPLDIKFDGQSQNLILFLEGVSDRAKEFDWDSILTVPDGNGVNRNLLSQYGLLTLENVRAQAMTYVATASRTLQNADMLYKFLISSLEKDFRASILLYKSEYTIGGDADGPMLLKRILMLTHIDTKATISLIRASLVNMSTTFTEYEGDVMKFNAWVRGQVSILRARGTESPDLLTYLWAAYETAPDSQFVKYMDNLHDNHNDDTKDYTAEGLMQLAEYKYKDRIMSGAWKKPNKEAEAIVALNAELTELRKFNQELTANAATNVNEEPKPKNKKKPGKPKWLLEKPNGNEKKEDGHPTKKVDEKKYYWCKHHNENKGQWVRHHPDKCNNAEKQEPGINANVGAFGDQIESDSE